MHSKKELNKEANPLKPQPPSGACLHPSRGSSQNGLANSPPAALPPGQGLLLGEHALCKARDVPGKAPMLEAWAGEQFNMLFSFCHLNFAPCFQDLTSLKIWI